MKRYLILAVALWTLHGAAWGRTTYNFNSGWLVKTGDVPRAETVGLDDSEWQRVSLPHAHNEHEAFALSIEQLTDTVSWYRKHFTLPQLQAGGRVMAEFEGVRQAGEFYINGHRLGLHENGVMAVGWDLTPWLVPGDNVLAVRTDNDWDYRERATGEKFQWNDRNFNANYGGIPKNVWLHVCGPVYQTLPLLAGLGTTGTYIWADAYDIPGRKATVHAETQVHNSSPRPVSVACRVSLTSPAGEETASFQGAAVTIAPGERATVTASSAVEGLEFWSWGYGYLYDVATQLVTPGGDVADEVHTRTGFRKTAFENGLIKLNDRVMQVHGYAQRTSNEWPAVGIDIPAWLSDYSNALMVASGGNLVRWMHVTPSKQDVLSCDRVGLIQAMPAADAEKDVEGRRWEHRVELMEQAMVYNRNNPSILFYECGNKGITPAHMAQMKALRDLHDPHGGRAIGCREMLGGDNAEYGGEMLYINRSGKHPVWAMEYCRDEGLRKYWDEHSWPWHREGEGPLYRGKDAAEYNRNQDELALEMVRRWNDYYTERPGAGTRSSGGGVKIIFSDTNTHYRGRENYRRSGVTDPMRITKDAFEAHRVMWDRTWVDAVGDRTYIIGHWNYSDTTVKDVHVVSTAPQVELVLNGRPLGKGERHDGFVHTFKDVACSPGTLTAIGRDTCGTPLSSHTLVTAGAPAALRLNLTASPEGFKADGADIALIQTEITDSAGRRCPLDNSMVSYTLEGPAEWLGGIAQGPGNYILARQVPVECGVGRVMVRSTTIPGTVRLTAHVDGLPDASVSIASESVETPGGLGTLIPWATLPCRLDRGPTPRGESFKPRSRAAVISAATAGSNAGKAMASCDDNEETEWASDGTLQGGWIAYRFDSPVCIDDICLKLTGWRSRSYPIEVLAGDTLLWSGDTPRSLGYVHLKPASRIKATQVTVRLKGASAEGDAFQLEELAGGQANALDGASAEGKGSKKSRSQLRIVEAEFLEEIR